MKKSSAVNSIWILIFSVFLIQCTDSKKLSDSVRITPGSVNGIFVKKNGKTLVIYGDPYNEKREADMVLFTHYRRDVIWAGKKLVLNGSLAVVPEDEKVYFTSGDSIWKKFSESRFHDYYCQTTKVGFSPFKADRLVRGGDILEWQGLKFNVLSTPGYTRGSVSYVTEIDGKKMAFTGDLIYGDGMIHDLYSYQDSYEEIGGYHGYASRLGDLISSLQLIAEQKPDIIVPARGPVIYNPESSVNELVQKIKMVYRNYLSISAYRWYFPDRMNMLAEHILGPDESVDWMPFSETIIKSPPEWYLHVSNSNLVLADDSTAFLIDCGTTDAFNEILKMKNSGRIKAIDGMFITHYHDDHTDYVNDIVKEFGCPVYVTGELKDILENPGAYQMPCLTDKSIKNLSVMDEGSKLEWKGFTLTFRYFPGQTIYHDAVLFEKTGGESIFFAGDSFTPSGIDDYCLLNRNLLHKDEGYLYCLDILKELPEGVLLANQHVEPLFAFSSGQLDNIKNALLERNRLFNDLFPWDDINYGIDEQWAKVYPYGQKAVPGDTLEVSVKIYNHMDTEKTFFASPRFQKGFSVEPEIASMTIKPNSEAILAFKIRVQDNSPGGISLILFDIRYDRWDLKEWCETIIEVNR